MIARAIASVRNRYLPIESSLLEMFVGLIMVLGTTNSVAVATLRSHYGINALLAASFGAAIAWGIVVGALNVLANHFKRTKRNTILNQARAMADRQSAVAMLEAELGGDVLELVPPDKRPAIYRSIIEYANQNRLAREGVGIRDLIGGTLIFVIRVLVTLPPSIPFLIMREPRAAILVSNLISAGLLFLIGYAWASFTSIPRLRFGATIAVVGLVLSAITIWLGS